MPKLLAKNPVAPPAFNRELSDIEARRMGIIVNRLTTAVLGDGCCLLRSLVLRHLLARRYTRSVVRFGVLPAQSAFAAHAWVEVDGIPVNDTVDVAERYLPTTSTILHVHLP